MTQPLANCVRLDRSKSHGTVHGVIEDGVHFFQDGLPFDAHGHLVEANLTQAQLASAERKAKRLKRHAPRDAADAPAPPDAPAAAPADTDEAEVDRATAPDSEPAEPADSPDATDALEVDLDAWLTGEQKYLFDAVRTAIRDRYQKDCKSVTDAVEFLVFDEELVPRPRVAKRLLPK